MKLDWFGQFHLRTGETQTLCIDLKKTQIFNLFSEIYSAIGEGHSTDEFSIF